jgi:hypothetical protein
MLIFTIPFGMLFLFVSFDPEPGPEIRIIVSTAFILFGIVFSAYYIVRFSTKINIDKEGMIISRRFGRIKREMKWDEVSRIQLEFEGKPRTARGAARMFKDRGTLNAQVMLIGEEQLAVKLSNLQRERLNEFVEVLDVLSNQKGVFRDLEKALWVNFTWTWTFEKERYSKLNNN